MKLKRIIHSTLLFCTIALVSCCGSDSDDSQEEGMADEPEVPSPTAATLVFPENNSECTAGIINPEEETLSTITFEWNASQNTDSYFVTVTNLNTGTSTFANVATNSADITIQRGTPFTWFVTSRAEGTTDTADSATFRFYNEGPGIENYAPFPAEAISPTRGQNLSGITAVNLQWSGNDVDDDIVDYEVFFGTDASALSSIGITTETSIADVGVSVSTTYYWKVTTKDSANNVSTSETFDFKVN